MSEGSKQLYFITGIDGAGRLDTRLSVRPEHLAYWQALGADLLMGGPFLDGDEKPCGSMLVIRAESLAAATALAEDDPYRRHGVFESISVRRWNWVVNAPQGV